MREVEAVASKEKMDVEGERSMGGRWMEISDEQERTSGISFITRILLSLGGVN
jgi:hypothetical protein